MKRADGLFKKLISKENMMLAYYNSRRGKGWYGEIKEFEKNRDENIEVVANMFKKGTYHTSKYITFKRFDRNKMRIIYKLPYSPDRIGQWAIMLVIEDRIIRHLTDDTYSAIPGRGVHKALKKLKKHLKKDPEGTRYCLKMDIHHYYPSIDHKILKDKFKRIIKDEDILEIMSDIIDSLPEDQGIPIGNYVSQYCGNFYLSDFDHWIKEQKHVRYYFRYMDDLVILGSSKKELHQLRREIQKYVRDNLKLEIKKDWQVFPVDDRGIDFMGYRVFHDYTLVRKSSVRNIRKSTRRAWNHIEKTGSITFHDSCSLNSHKGWIEHANTYRLRQKYIDPLQEYMKPDRIIGMNNTKEGKHDPVLRSAL